MALPVFRFSSCRSEDSSIGAVDAEGWWSPVAGVGRRGWHLNFLGVGGGDGVFLEEEAVAEDLWSWRWSVMLSGGTSWWRSPGHRWPSSEKNGSLQ